MRAYRITLTVEKPAQGEPEVTMKEFGSMCGEFVVWGIGARLFTRDLTHVLTTGRTPSGILFAELLVFRKWMFDVTAYWRMNRRWTKGRINIQRWKGAEE